MPNVASYATLVGIWGIGLETTTMDDQNNQELSGGPVAASGGDGTLHTIIQGECVSSIAGHAGFLWETIWDHPANSLVKTKRKDPNVLLPGDVLFIPRKTTKEVACATDMKHCFVRKGLPCLLRLQILDNDEIQANVSYILVAGGRAFQGTTDGEGKLEHPIPSSASSAKLIVGPQKREYLLDLGELDPITEMTGVQGRLRNLDYYTGDLDGQLNEKTKQALEEFQAIGTACRSHSYKRKTGLRDAAIDQHRALIKAVRDEHDRDYRFLRYPSNRMVDI